MEGANWHIFQVLTKRSIRMTRYLRRRYEHRCAPAHIWCGVSIEDRAALSRLRHIRQAAASIRFLSLEPLIGPLGKLDLAKISWVIVGGESGPRARKMEEDWVIDIRDQCAAQDVAFFFKQWGGLHPKSNGRRLAGQEYSNYPVLPPDRLQPNA